MNDSTSRGALRPLGLAVLLAGMLLPMIDFSIVNVALDSVAKTLGASETELELLVSVYGLAFALVLAMGGRLGDLFGRRTIFLCGVALFGLMSLLCGLSPSIAVLLVARAGQGVGAALLVPQVLASIHVCLSGRAHARAISLYGAIGGLAFIVGQVLGGFLVGADIAHLGWRSVFLINLPICAAILVFRRRLPETRSADAAGVDFPGTALLAALILCLLLPLVLPLSSSWAARLPLAAVLPLALSLWRVELRQQSRGVLPLLPPALLNLASMRLGLFVGVVFFASWGGFMFVLARALQAGAGLSALESGNSFIALGASYFVASLVSGRIIARLGLVRALLLASLIQIVAVLGVLFSLRIVWPHPGMLALALVPATVVQGAAQALIVSFFFRQSLADVPSAAAGAGSAMLSTIQQIAFGLGPALLGAVFMRAQRGGDQLLAVGAALLVGCALMSALPLAALLRIRAESRRVRRCAALRVCSEQN